MNKSFLIGVALVAAGVLSSSAAQNLVANGDFADEARFAKDCRVQAGKLKLEVEDLTWNKFGRLTLTQIGSNGKGGESATAGALVGSDGASDAIPLEGDTLYDISIDLRGTSPEVFVHVVVWKEGEKGGGTQIQTSLGKVRPLSAGWTRHRGTFRTPMGTVRGKLRLSMWWDTVWGKNIHKVGDAVDFDNISISARKGSLAEFAKRHPLPFAIAPVPPTVDVRLPFLPEEVMAPPTNIAIRAAQNAVKALPLALANLTGRAEEYRVTVETTDEKEELTRVDGRLGLNGFPSEKVTARRAVVLKDSDPAAAATYRVNGYSYTDTEAGRILDPMVRMDESFTVTVPPGEVRLVWFDFDTSGVRPGRYDGIVRVVPLSAPTSVTKKGPKAKYHDIRIEGAVQDVPIALEVLPFALSPEPVAPFGFYGDAEEETMFREMLRLGTREFQLNTWNLKFGRTADGDIDPGAYEPRKWAHGDIREHIREYRAWSAAAGVKIGYFVGYSCYKVFRDSYSFRNEEEVARLWPQWLRAVRKLLSDNGISDRDCCYELWDEPDRRKEFDRTIGTCRAAREALGPDARLLLTVNYNPWEPADIEEAAKSVNEWIFHDGKFLRADSAWEKYGPVIRRLMARGDRVSHYTCSVSIREDLDAYYRQNPWIAELRGLTGNHLYDIIGSRGGAGALDWKYTKLGGILYRSFHSYMPSIRALAIREGAEDVKYLRVLRERHGTDPAVRGFLADAAKRVTSNRAGGDRHLADRVREEAIDLILESKKKGR